MNNDPTVRGAPPSNPSGQFQPEEYDDFILEVTPLLAAYKGTAEKEWGYAPYELPNEINADDPGLRLYLHAWENQLSSRDVLRIAAPTNKPNVDLLAAIPASTWGYGELPRAVGADMVLWCLVYHLKDSSLRIMRMLPHREAIKAGVSSVLSVQLP